MAAWIASRKVIVGITGTPPAFPSPHTQRSPVDALLKKKSNPHLLESFHTRADKTRSFLLLFRPDLEYELVSLQDVYGPTGSDPDVHALVVSKETLSGAAASASVSSPLSSPLTSPSPSRQGARSQGSVSLANVRHRRHLIRLFETRSRRCRDPEADKDEQYLYSRLDRFKLCPLGKLRSLVVLYTYCIFYII